MATKLGIKAPPIEIERGTKFAITLPEIASALPMPLQDIARRYIGAQHHSGQALLDAARCMHEARAIAEHGDWQLFLDATKTSASQARRLLNIHRQVEQEPRFADGIREGWLHYTVAAELAQESTPRQVIEMAVQADEQPKVEDIRRAKKEIKSAIVADLDRPAAPAMHPDYQAVAAIERILKEAAGHGERTGTAMYQEAYGQARQIRDVTLYNRAFAMIDRAVEGEPAVQPAEQPKIPEVAPPAPLRRPRRPTSADSSAVLAYLDQIEAYATALEDVIRNLTR